MRTARSTLEDEINGETTVAVEQPQPVATPALTATEAEAIAAERVERDRSKLVIPNARANPTCEARDIKDDGWLVVCGLTVLAEPLMTVPHVVTNYVDADGTTEQVGDP